MVPKAGICLFLLSTALWGQTTFTARYLSQWHPRGIVHTQGPALQLEVQHLFGRGFVAGCFFSNLQFEEQGFISMAWLSYERALGENWRGLLFYNQARMSDLPDTDNGVLALGYKNWNFAYGFSTRTPYAYYQVDTSYEVGRFDLWVELGQWHAPTEPIPLTVAGVTLGKRFEDYALRLAFHTSDSDWEAARSGFSLQVAWSW